MRRWLRVTAPCPMPSSDSFIGAHASPFHTSTQVSEARLSASALTFVSWPSAGRFLAATCFMRSSSVLCAFTSSFTFSGILLNSSAVSRPPFDFRSMYIGSMFFFSMIMII